MGSASEDEKRARILDAAFAKFCAYGFGRTSMADIADAAEMSRPALYQYYANKEEILGAVIGRALETAADNAMVALAADADLAAQLDGFVQRWSGDLLEQVRGTEHGGELAEAKAGAARSVTDVVERRLRKALVERLATEPAGASASELADLLLLAPAGLKYDQPSMPELRRRLTTLAGAVAAAAAVTPGS